jgi:hypothetical protein
MIKYVKKRTTIGLLTWTSKLRSKELGLRPEATLEAVEMKLLGAKLKLALNFAAVGRLTNAARSLA